MPKREPIPLSGFDPEGEPQIDLNEDGSLNLTFEYMPPSWVTDSPTRRDLGPYKEFDALLAAAIDTEVLWEDRELFIIPTPKPDTIERLRAFLSSTELGRR